MNVIKTETLFKNHGKSIGWWRIQALDNGDGSAELTITHSKTLQGAHVQSTVPVAGKNLGKANETTPAQQAVLELDSRVNKQLDKGYVRTEAEASAPATNALGLLKPMLAQPISKVKPGSIDWENAWLQPKLDGHRGLHSRILYSRGGKEITGLSHIIEAIHEHGLADLHTDGELYIHGMKLQDIGSLIKRPREESLKLEYHVYDVISPAPFEERRALLAERLSHLVGINYFSDSFPIKLVPTLSVTSRDQVDILHRMFLQKGFEGSILRHGNGGYESDKRSNSLIKLKDFEDREFKVIGVKLGTPRTLPDGRVLQVPVWRCANPFAKTEEGMVFDVTAHGDMHEKDHQWQVRDTLIGRELTVQHFGFSNDGVPLIPVALRWREDL